MVAHFYVIHGDDLECCLKRPAALHRPFEQQSQDEQLLQLRHMHETAPVTRQLAPAAWSWYQIGIPKATALALLEGQPDGVFVIRSSETYQGWCVHVVLRLFSRRWQLCAVVCD